MDGAEKSFSHTSEEGPAYLKNNQAAAWRHYWRHLWAGMALSGVLVLGAITFRITSTETRYELTAGSYSETDFGSSTKNLISLGVMFLICSGTAAAVGGLLRHKHLVWLSKRVRSRKKLIWGSLMGFEISMLLIAVLHWWVIGASEASWTYQALVKTIMICFFVGLPWLLATGWASWRLATEARMPSV